MVKDVTRSPRFVQRVNKLDKTQVEQIRKLVTKIINNPEIGKPMRYDRKGTKEVYAGSFRVSYSYDKTQDVLYLLEIYHKDEQ